jgi:hypothetical protein
MAMPAKNISGTGGGCNRICRSISAALSLLAALALLAACAFPTFDQATLKAIQAESRTLMTTHSGETALDVPKSRWPRVIASLEPEFVMVFPDGVEILIKPDFDGGWGYHVPRNERQPPEPAGRYWALSHGVYWFHPY